ncbi:MAG: HAD-IB family hydrolase [Burkholderiaceae bacterium]|nr:HAD-IB family hydrolase [Burkholderiaceae bacterium]
MSIKLALFDLDHTLLPVDSCGIWAYFLISHCGAKAEEYKKQQEKFDQDYFQGILDIEEFMDFEMFLMNNFKRKELDQLREEYFNRFIKPVFTLEAKQLVQSYRQNGAKTAIVTATQRYPVEPIADLFEVDILIASEPEIDTEGEFTGGWLYHTYKEGKVKAIKKLLKQVEFEKIQWSEIAFYSDSINDLPLLSLVAEQGGKAVATNPDERLRSIAHENGWEILQLLNYKQNPEFHHVENYL